MTCPIFSRFLDPHPPCVPPVGRLNKTHKLGTKTINFFFRLIWSQGVIFLLNIKIWTFSFGLIKFIWYIYVIKYLKIEFENIITGSQDDFSVINSYIWTFDRHTAILESRYILNGRPLSNSIEKSYSVVH